MRLKQIRQHNFASIEQITVNVMHMLDVLTNCKTPVKYWDISLVFLIKETLQSIDPRLGMEKDAVQSMFKVQRTSQ